MKRLLPFVLLLLSVFCACDSRPDGVLSASQMEQVLYDYHIMQGLIDQLPADERMGKAQDYLNAVLAKHGITEAQFDSSIVYYNRYPAELHDIYTSLQTRYEAVHEELQILNGNNDMMAVFAEGGDTTNLWHSTPLIVLRNNDLQNRESFNIYSNGNFRRHDKFILTFTPRFVKQANDAFDIYLYVGLSVMYTSGRHAGVTRMISTNGTIQLTLNAAADEDIQQVHGFFYYEGKTGIRNLCFVDEIQLVCMHEKVAEPTVTVDSLRTDSLAKDTLKVDSTPVVPEQRLTPEEIRMRNKSNKNIDIQEMPSVRTPNSIGPKRRKTTKKQ